MTLFKNGDIVYNSTAKIYGMVVTSQNGVVFEILWEGDDLPSLWTNREFLAVGNHKL